MSMNELKVGEIVKILASGQELSGMLETVEEGFLKVRVITVDTLKIGERVQFSVSSKYEKTGNVVNSTETEIVFAIEGGVEVTYNKEDIDKVSLL